MDTIHLGHTYPILGLQEQQLILKMAGLIVLRISRSIQQNICRLLLTYQFDCRNNRASKVYTKICLERW